MASVKNIKSKSKGIHWSAHAINGSTHRYNKRYFYRALAFADLPPAKLVRPLRAVTRWVQQAADAYSREVSKLAGQGVDFFEITDRTAVEAEELTYRNRVLGTARRFAQQGNGQLVHRIAAAVA